MVLRSQLAFDKVYLDWNNAPDVREFIAHSIEIELANKLMDELKDHKVHIVELKGLEFMEDLLSTGESAIEQDLVCEKLVQCKHCMMVYPWCQKFRDEFKGHGFCPYGREFEDESFE